jgi:hypothetical protein
MIEKPNLVLPEFKEFDLDSPEYSDFLYSSVDNYSPLTTEELIDDTVTEVTVEEKIEVIPLGHPDNPVDTPEKLLIFSSLV